MSYLFQSRQLHPRLCRPGMGSVGPEQAWTQETARTVIAEATTPCSGNSVARKLSEYTKPKQQIGGEIVDDPTCVQTGKIWEARRPGAPRMVEWCCGKTEFLPHRALTQEEYSMWSTSCDTVQDEAGISYLAIPSWHDPNKYIRPPCVGTNVLDGGYELICCPAPGTRVIPRPGDVTFVEAAPSLEQSAEREAQRQQMELERAVAREAAALAPATLLDRYGLPMLLAGGIVVVGVTAALFKRSSASKKKKKTKKSKRSKKGKKGK